MIDDSDHYEAATGWAVRVGVAFVFVLVGLEKVQGRVRAVLDPDLRRHRVRPVVPLFHRNRRMPRRLVISHPRRDDHRRRHACFSNGRRDDRVRQ